MKPEELLSDIQAYCQKHAHAENVKKYSRYFREGYDAYGLTQDELYAKRDEILARPEITLDLLVQTSYLLIEELKYEETSFAIVLLRSFPGSLTRDSFRAVEQWFHLGIRNWAHADVICGELLSPMLMKGIITLDDLDGWRVAANKFQRRAVPVSLIKLLKHTKDFGPFYRIIESMMMDPEREVHQGLGWFLREAWKLKRKETENVLLRWKDKAPRLIFQYACEKMSAEEKFRFRKSK